MEIHWIGAGCAVAALAIAPGTAMAASETFSTDYSFELLQELVPDYAAASVHLAGANYTGSDQVFLSQFDTMGGSRILEQVTLTLEMTIQGQVFVEETPPLQTALLAVTEEYDAEAELYGQATAGPLTAVPSFNEVYGSIPNGEQGYYLVVDETASDSDSTNVDFASFLGNGLVTVDLQAMVSVFYPDQVAIGRSEGFTAFGDVSLTYTYRTPNGQVIPTPAAAGLGFALLVGAVSRRQR